ICFIEPPKSLRQAEAKTPFLDNHGKWYPFDHDCLSWIDYSLSMRSCSKIMSESNLNKIIGLKDEAEAQLNLALALNNCP
ncbi:hypothetical protein J0680_24755, partial [Vibrio parahaemolyticus]|uniref:hypothetical protein n=1 Tax=Vibrio parahaemolyticus TaxID=670 RepID=UPI001A8E6B02